MMKMYIFIFVSLPDCFQIDDQRFQSVLFVIYFWLID